MHVCLYVCTRCYPFNLERIFFRKECLSAHFQFFCVLHRKKIFNNKIVKLSLRSNLNIICRLNSENQSLSSRLLRQKPISTQSGSRFVAIKIVIYSCDWISRYAVWISKIVPLVLKLFAKYLFPYKPKVDFQRQQFFVITSIEPKSLISSTQRLHYTLLFQGHSAKTTNWATIHVVYYLTQWLSNQNIFFVTFFCSSYFYKILYLFKNNS